MVQPLGWNWEACRAWLRRVVQEMHRDPRLGRRCDSSDLVQDRSADWRSDPGDCLGNRAQNALNQRTMPLAEDVILLEKAIEQFRHVQNQGYSPAHTLFSLAAATSNLTIATGRMGRLRACYEAAGDIEKLGRENPQLTVDTLFGNPASHLCRGIARMDKGEGTFTAEDHARRAEMLDRAMRLVELTIARGGYKNRSIFETNDNYRALRDHPKYAELVKKTPK